MSAKLTIKIRLGLGELAEIREQLSVLIVHASEPEMPVIETAAACAMLHSFYTEIEKLLRIIASDLDEQLPSGESWHRDLLSQMARPTPLRPAVITVDMVSSLGEFLAFRHLFRGASIALMRWDRLSPLLAKIDNLHRKTVSQFEEFQKFLQGKV